MARRHRGHSSHRRRTTHHHAHRRKGLHHPHKGVRGRHHKAHGHRHGTHHRHLKGRLRRHLKGRKVVRVSRHRGATGHHRGGRRISVRRLLHLLTRHRLHLVRGLHSRRHRKVRLLRRPRAIPVSKG